MADDADRADERMTPLLDSVVEDARRVAAQIPVGNPGDCDLCGEHSMRLVGGVCAPCRDKYHLN
jgi:hypothetical protein